MAIRNIVTDSDPQLRKISREVVSFDEKLHKLLDDMRETMHKADGCGLAAPQVGILRRACIVETGDFFIEMMNPVILEASGSQISGEACLSVKNRSCLVDRPTYIKVEYFDRYGEKHIKEVENFAARAFCHEIDHLDGILFYDKEYSDGKRGRR